MRPGHGSLSIPGFALFSLLGLAGCTQRAQLPLPLPPEAADTWTARFHERTVTLRDSTGTAAIGREVILSPDAVTFTERGSVRTLPLDVVTSLSYRDRSEGMRRGASRFGLPGLAAGLLLGLVLAGEDLCLENCGSGDPSVWERLGTGLAGAVVVGGAGVAIGAPIGAWLFAWSEVSVSQ